MLAEQLRKQVQDDQLQVDQLLMPTCINKSTVNCWWCNPEVHQKQPHVGLDKRHGVQPDMLDPRLSATSSSSNIGAQAGEWTR